jgi:predicted phosphodiesterase
MLLAIFSDVHNNVRDLERCLNYLQRRGVDSYLQLGDLGTDPLRLLDGLPVSHVFGNWEVSGLPANPIGRWVEIAAWPARLSGAGWVAAHASPVLPDGCTTTQAARRYMTSQQVRWVQVFPSLLHDRRAIAAACAHLAAAGSQVAFHGHTHVQAAQQLGADGQLRRLTQPAFSLPPETLTLVGVGSVGVPRDGLRPRCVLFDPVAAAIELVTIPTL